MPASGFIVDVPEAEAMVGALRERHDDAAALGMPAHVTLLYPFMDPSSIDDGVLQRVRALCGRFAPFEYVLGATARFPQTAWLAPEPAAPFVALTWALVAEFPGYLPFGGEFDSVIPHLTVAHGDAQVAVDVQAQLDAALAVQGPIRATCRGMRLVENASGRWRTLSQWAFGPTSAGAGAVDPSRASGPAAGR